MKRFLQRYFTLHNQRLWLVLALVCFSGMIDITASDTYSVCGIDKWVGLGAIASLKALIFSILVIITRPVRWLHSGVKVLTCIYATLCVLNGIVFALFGMGFSIKLFAILGQTSVAEALNFGPMLISAVHNLFLSPWLYAGCLSFALIYYLLKYVPKVVAAAIIFLSSLLALPVSVVYFLNCYQPLYYLLLSFKIERAVRVSIEEHRKIVEEFSRLTPLPFAESVSSERRSDIIFVIGESVSPQYLSLYGFPLATSPEMDEMRDSLYVFTDAIGAACETVFNINRLLTFLTDRDDPTRWYDSPLLFSLLHEAGYHTAWISNQERGGLYANNVPAMVSKADVVEFVSSTSSMEYILKKKDGELLPLIEKVLRSDSVPQFIGAHLMGSHSDFRYRYPSEFSRFGVSDVKSLKQFSHLADWQAATLSYYLNSLYYTDYLLSDIVGMISGRERPTLMIYISDHGQNVFDEGSLEVSRNDSHIQVPFVIYANKAFREECPDLIQRIDSARSRPITTANLPHAICTLTGTSYDAYADTLDFLSPSFRPRHRWVDDAPWRLEHEGL